MKRFLDVLLSLLAIIFLSPLMLVICLIIICDDGMPVIFRQDRVGRGDKLFKIKKFRTMKNGAPNLSTADFEESDEYITRSGKFLRRTSLDELPQLFNVLAGDMSFIGPRPLIPEESHIRDLRREYGVYSVRPGVTGWAQVNGRDCLSDEEKASYDREYIERRSLAFDTKIFFRMVEQMEFEEVNYWDEITEIFDWARTHVTSTLYICWAAQAGLYHHYGIPKYALDKKMFGIFKHRTLLPLHPIFRGFDDEFYVPHSRHTEVRKEDILKVPELTLLSESDDSGVYMVVARGGREFFVTGHSEYSPLTLDTEYRRDVSKGLPIEIPRNYYVNDDPDKGPLVRWRGHANLLFSNWLNYFVYQETPYNIEDIR